MRKLKPEKALAVKSVLECCHCGKCSNKEGHSQDPFPLVVEGPILAPTSETQGRRAWPTAWLGLPAGPQRSPEQGPRRASGVQHPGELTPLPRSADRAT